MLNYRRHVIIEADTMDGIISYSMMNHPQAATLVVRGTSKNGCITVNGLVISPFGPPNTLFAGLPNSFLPLDSSYVGTVHSHPGGEKSPSDEELNSFFGLISLIIRQPYTDSDIFAWDSSGRPLDLQVRRSPSQN